MRHSQRANDSLLHAWVIVQRDGVIESGHCTCMAGLCEVCSHIGAVLSMLKLFNELELKAVVLVLRCHVRGLYQRVSKKFLTLKLQILHLLCVRWAKIQHTKSRGSHHYSDTVPLSDLPKVHVESPISLLKNLCQLYLFHQVHAHCHSACVIQVHHHMMIG